MRRGILCSLALLAGTGWVQAQQGPMSSPPHFPMRPGVSYPGANSPWGGPAPSGYYPMPAGYPTGYSPYGYGPRTMAPAYPPSSPPMGLPVGMPPTVAMPSAPPAPPVVRPPAMPASLMQPQAPTVTAVDTPAPVPAMTASSPSMPVTVVPVSEGEALPAMVHPPTSMVNAAFGDYCSDVCDPCDPCKPLKCPTPCREKWWLSADYLAAWVRSGPLDVPLVTAGSPNDASPGALGQPGTSVLFGNGRLNFGMQQGFRAEVGCWLDAENWFSAELAGFYLFPEHVNFGAVSDPTGNPLITRPVFNPLLMLEQAYLVAFPDVASGNVTIDARTQIYGGEINGRAHFAPGPRLHTEGLIGFRTIRLEESLKVRDHLQPLQDGILTFLGNPVGVTDILEDEDRFTVANQFYGIQLGGRFRWEHDWFFLDVYSKTGVGVTDQQAKISGQTSLISPATPIRTVQGGILAQTSNIGTHNRYVFGVTPEVGVSVGAELTRHLRVRAGYSWLFWNGVMRPGLVLDRVVNPSLVPTDPAFAADGGPGRPAFAFKDQVFWVHTFNAGVEIHY